MTNIPDYWQYQNRRLSPQTKAGYTVFQSTNKLYHYGLRPNTET
jgi:hypothetical protein